MDELIELFLFGVSLIVLAVIFFSIGLGVQYGYGILGASPALVFTIYQIARAEK